MRCTKILRLVLLCKKLRCFLNYLNYIARSHVYVTGSLLVFTFIMAVQAERTAKEASEALQRSKEHNLELESKLNQVREVSGLLRRPLFSFGFLNNCRFFGLQGWGSRHPFSIKYFGLLFLSFKRPFLLVFFLSLIKYFVIYVEIISNWN